MNSFYTNAVSELTRQIPDVQVLSFFVKYDDF